MAQPALDRFTKRGLAVAASGTPSSSANAILIMDASSGTEFDVVERNTDSAILGHKPFLVRNKRAYIEGGIEPIPPTAPGSATGTTGATPVAPVLLPCGFAQTLTANSRLTRYNPISSSFPTCNAKFWHASRILEIDEARGNLTGMKMEVGERFMVTVRLQGEYDEVDQGAVPTDFGLSAFTVPTVSTDLNSTLTWNTAAAWGTADITDVWAKLLSVDLGNEVRTKEFTSHKETGISDRRPTFTMRVARPDKTDIDFEALRDANTIIRAQYKTREADGRYTLLNVRGQIENVTPTEVDGDMCIDITGRCIPSSSGGDEVYIEYGDDTFAINGAAPDGTDSVAYTHTYVASGVYATPLVWTVSAGALPTGVTLDSGTGVISGTPSATGTFAFTITATDDDSEVANFVDSVDIA